MAARNSNERSYQSSAGECAAGGLNPGVIRPLDRYQQVDYYYPLQGDRLTVFFQTEDQ